MKYQISITIVRCFIPIDQHEAITPVITNQSRCGIHGQAGTGYDHQISIRNGRNTFFNGILIQGFFIEHYIRFYYAAADTLGYPFMITDKFSRIKPAAAVAIVPQHASVKFINILTASLLMESVNILCYNSRQFSLILPSCQDYMGNVRFKSQRQHFLPVESEEIVRLPFIKAVTNDCFRRILKFLIIESINTSKIRDSAFCRNSCASEKYDRITVINYIL